MLMQTAVIKYSFYYLMHFLQPDEHIVEALSQHPRQVLVVDGVEELRLV